jgi:cell division protein FtsL
MTYSSSLAAGRQRYATRQQNIARVRTEERRLGPISNTVLLIMLACLVGLLYLTQVTKTNSLSYKISDLQQQQASLKTEQDDLEVTTARLQSIERVKNSDVAKALVTAEPVATLQN